MNNTLEKLQYLKQMVIDGDDKKIIYFLANHYDDFAVIDTLGLATDHLGIFEAETLRG